MYCLLLCASELPDSGWEQGQTCQNPAKKYVADHGQEILKVPRDSLFLGDFHTKSADLRRSIRPPYSRLEPAQSQEVFGNSSFQEFVPTWYLDSFKLEVLFVFCLFFRRETDGKNWTQ